ncbi:TIGR01777 family oxidoreductase [Flavobacterium sp. Fl-77]|uniref:TIGR01777 family oxidoreductase n=1 Tax=Flavobacterium flavipigmentatum TaxID=2893884 RepID=A0AAJ2VW66_9FLAO|nr:MULTISPECIES: TIGR01777 family oxidoreductase [unclassified Flavobacterium]MDX6182510.1 TIGR01777 family oxidoreductase [Flavobacterium sp. Fl-33]MDX6185577.1 TIGR01777 family oxidoreductase [Flavobacterium sp. Fl-77]UFH38765.1 TIGR01777 family oxidoreductase [Flavobacterium sp. F-70]
MAKNVLITGGTGFIGKYLTDVLIANGYTVSILSRSERKNTSKTFYYKWNVDLGYIEEEAILKADYIIHLAGEGIVEKRWSARRKKAILDSRVRPIELIASILKKHNKPLDAFVSASAIGIYGAITNDTICTETSPAADDFLGHTCQEWEKAVDIISALGIRTAKIRTGIVLGRNEGFLEKIQPSFKLGLGSVLGTGKQYLPWIHIEDLCKIYLKTIQDQQTSGAYNAAVTDDTTNQSFSKTFARLLGYSIWLPKVPVFLLKIILGEMSLAILEGQRVSSEKIEKTGFQFEFTDLKTALSSCLS